MEHDDGQAREAPTTPTKTAGQGQSRELELLDAILKRRGFFWQSEEIYGGMRGFYDYGVLGAKLKHNVLSIWRKLFVIQSEFLEIDGSSIGSEKVFSASGHLEKFVDVVVNCQDCGAGYRADHLLKDHVENADGMPLDETDAAIERYGISCELCGGGLTRARTQNLMFELAVGRETTAYLRPETAQNIFLNFPNLYRYAREKLPFGVAQIGRGFRNEISPRQGLIRLREFNMAEVEYFYDESDEGFLEEIARKIREKDYPFLTRNGETSFEGLMKKYGATLFDAGDRYDHASGYGGGSGSGAGSIDGTGYGGGRGSGAGSVDGSGESLDISVLATADLSGLLDEKLPFVAANDGDPEELELSFAQTLDEGIICSPLLCHHLILAYAFMRMLGFAKEHLRFRQHLPREMAHYASDCWDLEVSFRTGRERRDWVETIGIADRSAYDLSSHMEASGRDFRVFEMFDEPRMEKVVKLKPNMKKLGKEFRKDARLISDILASAPEEFLEELKARIGGMDTANTNCLIHVNLATRELSLEGSEGLYTITPDSFSLEEEVEKVTGRRFIPDVIEPSYGVDRVIYGLLNNAIHHEKKEGEDYTYFTLSPTVAPITAGIFPLTKDQRLVKLARTVHEELKGAGFATIYDESGSVGRRYARMDEIGTPFCVTVDFDSLEDESVTIRFLDTRQIRVRTEHLGELVSELTRAF